MGPTRFTKLHALIFCAKFADAIIEESQTGSNLESWEVFNKIYPDYHITQEEFEEVIRMAPRIISIS